MLYEFAKKNNLGEVHSLGGCYGSYKDSQRRFEEKDTARGIFFLLSFFFAI